MVQFSDGSIKAQLGMPDMRLPIQYAFTYPKRIDSTFPRLDFSEFSSLTFELPDTNKFRNLAIAYKAMEMGGNMPCIVNAANEVVVEAFLKGRVGFLQMSDVIETVMDKACFIKNPSYEDYVETDLSIRSLTKSLIIK
jgi:1-deoxy-D-xylulose-5-phosphate reductoisomerase